MDSDKRAILERNIMFCGEQRMELVHNSFVAIFGLGGVGSHVALHLARSGVGRMLLVDADDLSVSSINRNAVGLLKDAHHPKVEVCKEYFEQIHPSIKVECIKDFVTKENVEEFLEDKPDYVIDCIDNMDTKVELVKYCQENDIPIIVSGGASCKLDPSAVQFGTIKRAPSSDKLLLHLRRRLRKLRMSLNIPCVFSLEQPLATLIESTAEVKTSDERREQYGISFRRRILPSMSFVPAVNGIALASYVFRSLAQMEPRAMNLPDVICGGNTPNLFLKALEKLFKDENIEMPRPRYDLFDVQEFICCFNGNCLVCDENKRVLPVLYAEPTSPIIYSIAPMCRKHAEAHYAESKIPEDYGDYINDRYVEAIARLRNMHE
ncbi:hypothetical protein PCE1_001915 [Barthelona sp. PCE]